MEGEKVPGSGRDIPNTNRSRHDTFLDSERGLIISHAERICAFAGYFASMPFKSILLAMRGPLAESIPPLSIDNYRLGWFRSGCPDCNPSPRWGSVVLGVDRGIPAACQIAIDRKTARESAAMKLTDSRVLHVDPALNNLGVRAFSVRFDNFG
jgi:hypothetical protein